MGPLYNCSQGITFPIVSRSCWLAVAGSKGRKAGGIHQKHTFTKLQRCDSTYAPLAAFILCSKCIASVAL